MDEWTPPVAAGKVIWHFSMTLDGFVAGPDHDLSWMEGITGRDGLVEAYIETLGAVIGGRRGWDAFPGARPYGTWDGPVFVLTHHPQDAPPADGVTFLDVDVAEAVEIAREAAGGRNIEVHSPTIGAELLARGLLDQLDLHIAPVLLGDGIRLYDAVGRDPIRLRNLLGDDPHREVDLRYEVVR
ncbi:dihydrofolate reductase family protein [Microbacterium sp.]|uniref:dihydrofolate reductase family protein n=1 Tax=Microbacterium sp. TaxID=51671 RepID=UPI002812437F|nr:dihydrofolate reductase family protein [Microbacterium sp.]